MHLIFRVSSYLSNDKLFLQSINLKTQAESLYEIGGKNLSFQSQAKLNSSDSFVTYQLCYSGHLFNPDFPAGGLWWHMTTTCAKILMSLAIGMLIGLGTHNLKPPLASHGQTDCITFHVGQDSGKYSEGPIICNPQALHL